MSLYEILKQRGYIAQMTHEEEIKDLLNNQKIPFYIGFDPTAASLHVGHFLQIMAAGIMQKYGHVPIILIGGGTTMVGDPSGRTDMRKMLTQDEINANGERFKNQLKNFISFENNAAIMVNNADWLLDINYIDFLREYGSFFSVNRMLTAEAYKNRMEKGLTFLEFNYMIMQAYDFLQLNIRHGVVLQMGGNDQWSNIIAGVDLIRRVRNTSAYGLTFTLLTTGSGEKMGKTAKGALWLDKNKTTPYEFYQYFRNTEDTNVSAYLKLLTNTPLEEIKEIENLKGKEINQAKTLLAYEITKLVHGEEEAGKAKAAALSIFEAKESSENMPSYFIDKTKLEEGISILELLQEAKLISSRSEGRRLIRQKGIKINGVVSEDEEFKVKSLTDLIIQKGKKTYCKIIPRDNQ